MDTQAVNMVEQARLTQTADSRLEPGEIRLIAPAKVNLFLDIAEKRADGYHNAVSIMHALMLHDVLRIKCEPRMPRMTGAQPDSSNMQQDGLAVEVVCVAREGLETLDVPAEQNIATKAVRLLAQLIQRNENESMRIIIEKHIPAQAGLGGGSSDAAAALVGAAHLWGLPADDPRIEQAARQLGADVAFFLHGGCACFTGVGDTYHHSLNAMSNAVVLIKPEGGVSTKEAYNTFDQCPDEISAEEKQAALSAECAGDVPLRNNLVCASEKILPALKEVREWVCSQSEGVQDALMSGSGSAIFVVCDNFQTACRVAAGASAKGWWSRATTFGPARAAIVPTR